MKTLIRLLVLAIALAVPSVAFAQNNTRKTIGPSGGGITTFNVGTELRSMEYILGTIMVPIKGTDVTVGIDGIVGKADLFAGTTTTAAPSFTLGALPYPAKLNVAAHDGGAGTGAITCTSVTLSGYDQFGNAISETVSTITESASRTTKVYESVSSAVGAGCALASGGDSSDDLWIYVSSHVGLPYDIRSEAAIINFCATAGYAAGNAYCYKGGASDSATEFDNAGASNRVDVTYESLDVATNSSGHTLADGHEIRIRLRAPRGAR